MCALRCTLYSMHHPKTLRPLVLSRKPFVYRYDSKLSWCCYGRKPMIYGGKPSFAYLFTTYSARACALEARVAYLCDGNWWNPWDSKLQRNIVHRHHKKAFDPCRVTNNSNIYLRRFRHHRGTSIGPTGPSENGAVLTSSSDFVPNSCKTFSEIRSCIRRVRIRL